MVLWLRDQSSTRSCAVRVPASTVGKEPGSTTAGREFAFCEAAANWLSVVSHQLSQDRLDLLNRALLHDEHLEVSARVMFRAGAVVLEISDGTRKTELARFDVPALRPDDGFGHSGEGAKH